jgi:hypothetical protein
MCWRVPFRTFVDTSESLACKVLGDDPEIGIWRLSPVLAEEGFQDR